MAGREDRPRSGTGRSTLPELVGSWYLRAYDRMLARPGLVLGLVAALALVASTRLPGIELDMSFRPLFGQDRAALDATARFEERFGQRSGAYIGAILTPEAWDAAFVEALARASTEAESIPGVAEVVGLARAARPVWTSDGAGSRWLVEPGSLESVSEPELRAFLALKDSPDLRRTLVSASGDRTVLLARLEAPLEDLEARAPVIERFKEIVTASISGTADVQWVGISVVEEAYARLVLRGLAVSFVLTTVVLLLVLFAVYRRIGAVAVVMTGVSLSLPVAVAAMVLRGQAVTIVNSMVPTMVLIIGVADAIHMLECFGRHVRDGRPRDEAVREMFGDMALPCLLTSLTTIVGVLALTTAGIEALRDFGLNVAVGIAAVYVANLLTIPAILRLLPVDRVVSPARGRSPMTTWREATASLLVRRPGAIALATGLVIVSCAIGVARLDVDQRFNEDVAADHPVRVAQNTFEREFTGLLGPDVVVRRTDGAQILGEEDGRPLQRVVDALTDLPGVLHVESVLDLVPGDAPAGQSLEPALSLRSDPRLGRRARDVLDEDGTGTTVVVRTADIGSKAALELADRIERVASRELGDGYDARVVGQWWLAQLGLSGLLRDMLVGFATSFALVLPLLALALGARPRNGASRTESLRLLAVAVVPNLLPPLFALGFMGWMGISVRVGTAMILAIALAIAVDDTIHVLVRIVREGRRSTDPRDQIRRSIDHVGGPLLLTTVVLVAGFLSMRLNGLVAIRDMGLVASVTLTVAFLADIYLLPALYLITCGRLPRSVAAAPLLRSADER